VTAESPLGNFAAYSGVVDLLLAVSTAFVRDAAPSGASRLPETVSAIRRYIESNYASVTSIDSLAREFYYSREHLSRVFRKYYNIAPHEYIEQCRIREAMRRIRAGERVADVCYLVGYRSMSVFLAAFRRFTGVTPSVFRHREGDNEKYSQK
jgi:AraC-like DNA-binding protein